MAKTHWVKRQRPVSIGPRRKVVVKPRPSVFGNLLRAYRTALNIGLEELAAWTEINIGTLSLTERGHKRPPELYPHVLRIAEKLQLDPGTPEYGQFLNAASSERFPARLLALRHDPLCGAVVVENARAEAQVATGSTESPAVGPPAPTNPREDSMTETSEAASAALPSASAACPPALNPTEARGYLDASALKAIISAVARVSVSGAERISVRTKGGEDYVFPVIPAQDEEGAAGR